MTRFILKNWDNNGDLVFCLARLFESYDCSFVVKDWDRVVSKTLALITSFEWQFSPDEDFEMENSRLESQINTSYACASILSGLNADPTVFFAALQTQINRIRKLIKQESKDIFQELEHKERNQKLSSLVGHFLISMMRFSRTKHIDQPLDWDWMVSLLESSYQNYTFLQGFKDYIKAQPKKSTAEFKRVFEIMKENIGSFDCFVRGITFDILNSFEQLEFLPTTQKTVFTGPINVSKINLDIPNLSRLRNGTKRCIA